MHLLVVANETVDAQSLREVLRASSSDLHVTVVSPISEPQRGYVVYSDTRRASARRRLERALGHLRQAGVSADGYVVDADPRRRCGTRSPSSSLRSTRSSSRRTRRSVRLAPAARRRPSPQRRRRRAGRAPRLGRGRAGGGERARDRQRDRARRAAAAQDPRAGRGEPASFLVVCPQSDPTTGDHPEAERRLKRALSQLRGEGIDAHGQVAHPDPFSAAMDAVHDERIDEIVVSTFEPLSSGWLRKDLVDRLRSETGLPVEHVIVAKAAEVPA